MPQAEEFKAEREDVPGAAELTCSRQTSPRNAPAPRAEATEAPQVNRSHPLRGTAVRRSTTCFAERGRQEDGRMAAEGPAAEWYQTRLSLFCECAECLYPKASVLPSPSCTETRAWCERSRIPKRTGVFVLEIGACARPTKTPAFCRTSRNVLFWSVTVSRISETVCLLP